MGNGGAILSPSTNNQRHKMIATTHGTMKPSSSSYGLLLTLKTTADNADIIAAAEHAARHKRGQKRGTFPRFIVQADGSTLTARTVESLARIISTVRQGTPCYIFRNYGHGATLTFDRPEWWPN